MSNSNFLNGTEISQRPPCEDNICFPTTNPPIGCLEYDVYKVDSEGIVDLGAISSTQQDQLNEFKKDQRRENEIYLRKHPEIDALISLFLGAILKSKPDDIYEFAANYFKNKDISNLVKRELEIQFQGQLVNSLLKII